MRVLPAGTADRAEETHVAAAYPAEVDLDVNVVFASCFIIYIDHSSYFEVSWTLRVTGSVRRSCCTGLFEAKTIN